jgi:hypothetical protein
MMKKNGYIITLTLLLILVVMCFPEATMAQCAMCKAQLENKVDAKNTGINSGILYLMIFPYLLIATVAFFWYKQFKKAKKTPAS